MKSSIFVKDIEIQEKKKTYGWGGMVNPSNKEMVYISASLITILIAHFFHTLS